MQMITKNFEDYPEHRLKFFSLLRAIAAHCFPALIRLSPQVGFDLSPTSCMPLFCTLLKVCSFSSIRIIAFTFVNLGFN